MIPDCISRVLLLQSIAEEILSSIGSPECNSQKYCCSDAVRGIAVELRVSTWHVELDLKGSLFKNVT